MSILVVGSVAFDTVETPFGKAEKVLGGSASFFSVAASFFVPVNLVGVVGSDFGDKERAAFQGRDIDLTGLETVEGKTFHWGGKYSFDLNSRDTLFTDLNVFEFFKPRIPDAYRQSRHVFLGNIDPVLQRGVLDQVEKPELVACDTMNFWISGQPEQLKQTLARVDVLLINDAEARQLSGEWNLVKAARAIRAMGPQVLVVKKGEHGVVMFTEEGAFAAPAFPLEEVFDPTGRGRHLRRRVPGLSGGRDRERDGRVGPGQRRGPAAGDRHGQHARVVQRRGLQPGPAAHADARRDRRALPTLQAPHLVRVAGVSTAGRLGLLVLATLASYPVGLAFGHPCLLPALNTLPAYLTMVGLLRRQERRTAVVAMLVWAVALAVGGTVSFALWPWPVDAAVLNGPAYREEMFSWILTGIGREGSPSRFLPQHLGHLAGFVVVSLASASALSITMGAVLMNFMSFYVASLVRAGVPPWAVLLLGWQPWAICRVAAFCTLGVVLSEPLLSRVLKYRYEGWPAARPYVIAAAGGILADWILKAVLAPTWGLWLRPLLAR